MGKRKKQPCPHRWGSIIAGVEQCSLCKAYKDEVEGTSKPKEEPGPSKTVLPDTPVNSRSKG